MTLQFDLDRDIDGAAVDLQAAIAEVAPLLPPGMPAPPAFRKVNPADEPFLHLGADLSHGADLGARRLRRDDGGAPHFDRAGRGPGPGEWGAEVRGARAGGSPKLRAQQIGINDIDAALQNWNVNLPTGQLFGATRPTTSRRAAS